MYQCLIPPRLFLAVGVGLLIFSLVLGWISFSVPDWLQFYERNVSKNKIVKNNQTDSKIIDEYDLDLKKFGLWYKCTFSVDSNDFICSLWNRDAPSNSWSIFNLFKIVCIFDIFDIWSRFCSSRSSSNTDWFIIGMCFSSIGYYGFHVSTSLRQDCSLCSFMRFLEL
jgi:hypothetical protein